MKNIFVLPNASHIYKKFDRKRKSGDLNSNELECLLFEALWLLEETEADRNRQQSIVEWGEPTPFWEGQK
jgi:hypothetical protein|tara:strand:- start:926 stop:1135 length:210 start_codon:yes stop_codon:yes gene_type:complete